MKPILYTVLPILILVNCSAYFMTALLLFFFSQFSCSNLYFSREFSPTLPISLLFAFTFAVQKYVKMPFDAFRNSKNHARLRVKIYGNCFQSVCECVLRVCWSFSDGAYFEIGRDADNEKRKTLIWACAASTHIQVEVKDTKALQGKVGRIGGEFDN